MRWLGRAEFRQEEWPGVPRLSDCPVEASRSGSGTEGGTRRGRWVGKAATWVPQDQRVCPAKQRRPRPRREQAKAVDRDSANQGSVIWGGPARDMLLRPMGADQMICRTGRRGIPGVRDPAYFWDMRRRQRLYRAFVTRHNRIAFTMWNQVTNPKRTVPTQPRTTMKSCGHDGVATDGGAAGLRVRAIAVMASPSQTGHPRGPALSIA